MPTLPPDTSLSFQDLILRTAEECSLGYYDSSNPDTPAAIPIDRGILDKIKRSVNDGCQRLARAWPKCSALRPQVSFVMDTAGTGPLNLPNALTVASGASTGDPSIYRLPWYITGGRPINGWSWASQSSGFSGKASDADPEYVDRMHRTAAATGYPQCAAVVPSPIRGDAGTDRQTKAVRFYPAPDQAYLVTGRFLIACPKLVALTDRHIFGASHDQTVLAFALLAFKEHDAKDPSMRATYQARADRALAESIVIDQENAQKTLGVMSDPGVDAGGDNRWTNPGYDVLTTAMETVL